MKDAYITLKKAEENHKELDINEIVKGKHKSENQKRAIKTLKTFYKSRGKVIALFDNFSKIISKAKYRSIYGEELKILTSKQIFKDYP